jgi:allantoinase
VSEADLIVRNGIVVTSQGRGGLDLAIRNGVFVAIAQRGRLAVEAREELDAEGRYVLPGVIDGHVHFREPGMEHKGDWRSESRSAVMGGVTTVIDMPNTIPPTATEELVQHKASLAGRNALCDFRLFGLLATDSIDELRSMAAEDAVLGFKAFLAPTTGDVPPVDDVALAAGMRLIASLGMRLAVHAEDAAIVERTTRDLHAAGRTDALAHCEARPVEAEVRAVDRVGRVALDTGCAVHIVHVTSSDALEAIARWRAEGVDITCEVTPHHCFLTTDDAVRLGPSSRVNPPLREPGHGDALLAALADGTVTSIATDHAPHAPDEKSGVDVWAVAPGFPGVETSLRLFLTDGVHAKRLTLEQLVRATSEGPARAWGLWPRKGAIDIGSDADLTIVDLDVEGVIRGERLHGRSRQTPFEGYRTRGAPVTTIVHGRVVMRDGRLVAR